jgi:hypothetical protein
MPWLFAWLCPVHLCWIGGILDRLEKIAMLLRQRTWEIFEVADQGDSVSRLVDYFLLTLIFANVVAVIAGTVDSIAIRFALTPMEAIDQPVTASGLRQPGRFGFLRHSYVKSLARGRGSW